MEYDESDDVIRMASGEDPLNAVGADSMSTPLLLPGDIRGQTSTVSLEDNELGSLVGAGADGYGLTSDEQI